MKILRKISEVKALNISSTEGASREYQQVSSVTVEYLLLRTGQGEL